MSKEWFLKCLADPRVFDSVKEFQYDVQDGRIIESDGYGFLLFINKETLQLEKGESCFKDGLDVWKATKDDYCLLETIERIINHFSDDKRQLIGVMWYNK